MANVNPASLAAFYRRLSEPTWSDMVKSHQAKTARRATLRAFEEDTMPTENLAPTPPQTKLTLNIDITPPGWKEYQLEDMTRAAAWVVRHFKASGSVKVLSCTVAGVSLTAAVEVASSLSLDVLSGIPEMLRGLAAIPLSPCPCGCGAELSVCECYRDALLAEKKNVRLTDRERSDAVEGRRVLDKAIRDLRARTGIPLADAIKLVEGAK